MSLAWAWIKGLKMSGIVSEKFRCGAGFSLNLSVNLSLNLDFWARNLAKFSVKFKESVNLSVNLGLNLLDTKCVKACIYRR